MPKLPEKVLICIGQMFDAKLQVHVIVLVEISTPFIPFNNCTSGSGSLSLNIALFPSQE
jgi:hypothetical protein